MNWSVSTRNLAWSRARGGVEFGAHHYPFMVVLHTGLLVGALVEAYVREPVATPAGLGVVDGGRRPAHPGPPLVVHRLLGRRWNTRVIIVPGKPPIIAGPYHFLSHPNYVAVVVEGIALPLVHAAWITAVVFTVLNAVLLTVRIRVEDAALATLPREPADA